MGDSIQLQQKWVLLSQLAKGGFARVYDSKSQDDESAVVKLVPKAPGLQRELLFEELNGVPNIVPIIESGEWDDDHWALVMPKAEKSLRDFLGEMGGQLSVDDTISVLADVAEALVAINGRVVHRDIKPENILLMDGKWCLADFGIARYVDATTAPDTLKHAKSWPYAAPEQWREERAVGATDIYALGVVAYELLAGRRPFLGPHGSDYRDQHLRGTVQPISGVPPLLQSLVVACLSKPTGSRPSAQNLLTQLTSNQKPASPSTALLQQANAAAVSRRAEEERRELEAQLAIERTQGLFDRGRELLNGILDALNQRIVENAPSVAVLQQPLYRWSLSQAALGVDRVIMTQARLNADMPFEVAAHTTIMLSVPRDRRGYRGRSHSLWYCDAQQPGVFRWFETAFHRWMGVSDGDGYEPFSLPPGDQDANFVLRGVTHTVQAARAFEAIDQGDEGAFFERWLAWFALAAQGQLRSPNSMPETPPQGSWRRGV